MLRVVACLLIASLTALQNTDTSAAAATYSLRLRDAENCVLASSHQLRAFAFDFTSSQEQANAQFASLLPKLTFQGTYQYFGAIPQIAIGAGPAIPFGTNSTYSVGPVLSYTLWDSFSSLKSYHGTSRLAEAKQEDLKNAELQALYSVRNAYIQVQLALEELRLTNESLALSRAQDRDVTQRFKAGGAARLDLVAAHRSVLSYELQFKQKQSLLSSALRDLLSLIHDRSVPDFSHPGPAQTENVTLVLNLDPLETLVREGEESMPPPPDDHQPQIRSLNLQGETAELLAASQSSRLFPIVQVSGGISWQRPNTPNPPDYMQETIMVAVSMPLYLGDPTPHLASQQRAQAEAVFQRRDQARINIERDFSKATETLQSLHEQRELAARDILQSEEVARLYYTSYRAGKINLVDVQNADVQALQAKVNRARIDAQILSQLMALKALSGKELHHE